MSKTAKIILIVVVIHVETVENFFKPLHCNIFNYFYIVENNVESM